MAPFHERGSGFPNIEGAGLALLLFLMVGPLAWTYLMGQGVVPDPVPGPHGLPRNPPARVEWGMLCQSIGCVLAVAVVRFSPLGVPLLERVRLSALVPYLVLLPVWIALLFGYLSVVDVQVQAHLYYFTAPDPARPGFWGLLLLAVVLGPLAEEVVFRGYLQGWLARFSSAGPAIAVSALVFGFVHGLQDAAPLVLLGAIFGWIRHRSGGLAAPFCAHALHNAITVAVTMAWPEHLEQLYLT